MLSIEEVTKLYRKCVEIKFKRKNVPDARKGDYCPSCRNILIFHENLESKLDLNITILHEFIHARDDLINDLSLIDRLDEDVDQEALETYQQTPEVLEYIKQLYKIR